MTGFRMAEEGDIPRLMNIEFRTLFIPDDDLTTYVLLVNAPELLFEFAGVFIDNGEQYEENESDSIWRLS